MCRKKYFHYFHADHNTGAWWELLCSKAGSSPPLWTGWTATMSKPSRFSPHHHLPWSRDDGLEALDRSDWTDLWSQLMQELRTGMKVKISNDETISSETISSWERSASRQIGFLSSPSPRMKCWWMISGEDTTQNHLNMDLSLLGLRDSSWHMSNRKWGSKQRMQSWIS